MGWNMSNFKQVEILVSTPFVTPWDQAYPCGFFDPEKAKKVWSYESDDIREKLYLTVNDNWVLEMIDAYGKNSSRYLELPSQRACSWLAMLDEDERQDVKLTGEL
jgi:hypothetical protein